MLDFQVHANLFWVLFTIFGGLFLFFAATISLNLLFYWLATRKNKTSNVKTKLAEMVISGVLQYSDRPNSNFRKIMTQIETAYTLKPKVLIVRINSPGGSAGASHEIYEALKALREKNGTKIVVLMEDVAASGGVYVSMAADRIVATPGTLTGSIGVIVKHVDVSSLLEIAHIKVSNIKSGANKDMLASTKPMSDEAKALMQKAIADCYESFCGIVAGSRGLLVEEVKTFADGRIISATEAKKCGLIDEVGGYETALVVAKDLAQLPKGEANIHIITPPTSLMERLGMMSSINAIAEKMENVLTNVQLNDSLWMIRE